MQDTNLVEGLLSLLKEGVRLAITFNETIVSFIHEGPWPRLEQP